MLFADPRCYVASQELLVDFWHGRIGLFVSVERDILLFTEILLIVMLLALMKRRNTEVWEERREYVIYEAADRASGLQINGTTSTRTRVERGSGDISDGYMYDSRLV